MRYLMLILFCLTGLLAGTGQAMVSTLVADTKSGTVLSSQNAKERQYPASLTKVMTLYLTFNALENGLLKMDDKLPISLHAAKQSPSKLYLKAGDTIRVKDAVMGLIIKSANDAAVVLAEALAPSEREFAKMMTQTAQKLGLKNTQFRNASGLHNPQQYTTAEDMALLTIAMINHFPQYYKLFSQEKFRYRGKEYRTHNRVTLNYKGAEGLKTGYIAAVGFNIISTAKRNNNRLVAVVIGQNSTPERDKQAIRLLDNGFDQMKKHGSVLQKLCNQGKFRTLNKDKLAQRPNLNPMLKTMKNRLVSTRKAADAVQQKRVEKLKESGVLTKMDTPSTTIEAAVPNKKVLLAATNQEDQVLDDSIKLATILPEKDAIIETAEEVPSPTNETLAAETTENKDRLIALTSDQPNEPSLSYTPVAELHKSLTNKPITTEAPQNVIASTDVTPVAELIAATPLEQQAQPTEQPTELALAIPAETTQNAQVSSFQIADQIIEERASTEEPLLATNAETENVITSEALTEVKPTIAPMVAQTTRNNNKKKSMQANQGVRVGNQNRWGIQVGAYYAKEAAQAQAQKALKMVKQGNKTIQVSPNKEATIYRSRIYGFQSKKEAQSACRKLKNNRINCLPVL